MIKFKSWNAIPRNMYKNSSDSTNLSNNYRAANVSSICIAFLQTKYCIDFASPINHILHVYKCRYLNETKRVTYKNIVQRYIFQTKGAGDWKSMRTLLLNRSRMRVSQLHLEKCIIQSQSDAAAITFVSEDWACVYLKLNTIIALCARSCNCVIYKFSIEILKWHSLSEKLSPLENLLYPIHRHVLRGGGPRPLNEVQNYKHILTHATQVLQDDTLTSSNH